MNHEEALALLVSAVAERDTTAARAEQARKQLYDVIRTVTPDPLKQVEVVRETGWTREHIRTIAKGDDQ